jgi:hypothetical protein
VPARVLLPIGRRAALAILVVVAAVGVTIGIVASNRAPHHVAAGVSATQPNETGQGSPNLPIELAAERLFFAEPGRTGLYQSDGLELNSIGLSAAGYPLQPLVSGLGVVVFIHDNAAYRTSLDAQAPVTELSPATWIFPGRNGSIGIQNSLGPGPSTIRYMDADGEWARGHETVLPAKETALAQLPLGLVVARGANLAMPTDRIDHLEVSLLLQGKRSASQMQATGFEPWPPEFLGAATAILGVHGSTVAWIRCPDDKTVNCSLYLVNTTNLVTSVVQEPRDSVGFAQGGGFSPDGRLLATFVRSGISDGGTVLQLEVYNLASGTLTPVGSPVVVLEPDGTATWSSDGRFLYFGGLLGRLYAEPSSAIGTPDKPVTLPLTTSFSVVGY